MPAERGPDRHRQRRESAGHCLMGETRRRVTAGQCRRMREMRILFIVNSFPCISETFVVAQVVGLLQRGHEVNIMADRPPGPPVELHADIERFRLLDRTQYRPPMPAGWAARLQGAASRVRRWGLRDPGSLFESFNVLRYGRQALDLSLLYRWFPAQTFDRDYDIIHCHFGPNGQRAVVMRNVGAFRGRIITTFHGFDANFLPRIHGPRLYESLFKYGDLFTVGSEFMRRRIVSLGAPKGRIVKVPMGVDLSRYRFAERRKPDHGKLRLLTVARLAEAKGVEYVLRGIAMIKEKCPRLRLRYLVAGDGPLRSKLEALVAQLGLSQTVEFLGAVSQEQAISLYETAHAFVLASVVTDSGEEESQSVVLAEAQASGLPVVATNIGGIPESVRDGESALLVPQRNPGALASAILWLVDHPKAWGPMGRAGRVHVEEHFNLERCHNLLVDIYRLVLASPREAPDFQRPI
jgi:colanic acid/amylovoran biosynthesis glycosyltransferase